MFLKRKIQNFKDSIYFSTSFDNEDEAFKWFKDMTECYKGSRKASVSLFFQITYC